MKKRYWVIGLIGVIFMVLLKRSFEFEQQISTKEIVHNEKKQDSVKVTIHRSNGIEIKDLEEYVMGVVAGEMPVSFELEALKAQSVAARTFVYQRMLEVDDTTASQVYKDEKQLKEQWKDAYETNWNKIKQAVNETKGEVVTYQGGYITAAFFSSSCGNTNHAIQYWQKDVPYLKSVPSTWEQTLQENYEVDKEVSVSSFESFMNETLIELPKITYYDSGYVEKVCVNNICRSGREIREAFSLRSSCFDMKKQGDKLIFHTKGSGHGIGMSQYGAQGMALERKNYKEILKYYYQGVEITKAHV